MKDGCIFCDYKNDEKGIIIFENKSVICIKFNDKILIGSCLIIPKNHKETVFDLSVDEWVDTKQMIDTVKKYLDKKYQPNGYNLGWNVGAVGGQEVFHAHLHIISRFKDEPLAYKGIRYWFKQDNNKRILQDITSQAKTLKSKNKT